MTAGDEFLSAVFCYADEKRTSSHEFALVGIIYAYVQQISTYRRQQALREQEYPP